MYGMQMKINGNVLRWLFIGMLIGTLVPFSAFYVYTIISEPQATSGEGNTTIIRIYREYMYALIPAYGIEQYQEGDYSYFLDVEHRIYPQSIEVPYGAEKTLWMRYTLDIQTAGDWDVRLSENQELTVEVPRTPSGCYIRSELVFTSATSFEVTIRLGNPTPETWNVGRPLVKVFGIYLGQPSNMDIGTPDIRVTIEAYVT